MRGLNLSSFKKIKEDKNTATMQHKSGHSLIIAKGSLKPLERKQLEALPVHKAMGGKVPHYDEGTADVEPLQVEPVDDSATPPAPSNQAPLEIEPVPDTTTPPADESSRDPASAAPSNTKPQVDSSAFQQEKNANIESAGAVGKQGADESEAIQGTQDQIEALPSQSDIVQANKEKSDALYQAFKNKQLDPDHYWKDHSKVAGGIGMVLSAIGGGIAHQSNAAMDVVNNNVNRDIALQKNDQDQKLNLWKMNREALGSDLAANLATQNQLYTGLKYKLDQAAASAMGPKAIAAAHMANAQINQKIAMNSALLGLHSGLTQQAGDGSEQSFIGNMNTASRLAPEMAKEAQAKYVPGVGTARVPLTNEDRSTLTSLDNLEKQLDSGINFAKTVGTTMPGSVNNQRANDIQNGIQLEIGNLVGLKRINEFEAKKYTDMAGNPGAIRTGSAVQSLSDLKNDIATKRQAIMSNLGVTPFKKAPQDQVAVQWAQSHPQDPRAAKILQANGAK